MVLYFSGTGNSKFIAEQVAEKLNSTLYSINDGIKQGKHPVIEDDWAVVVVPTYAWRVPRVVSRWMTEGSSFSGKKVWFLMTCGSENSNAEAYARKLCGDCGCVFMGCAEIHMPENYIAMFDCPSEAESLRIVEGAEQQLETLVTRIGEGKSIPSGKVTLADRLKSGIVNDVFYSLCVSSKKFYTKDSCVGCGKCQQVCPMNNISMEQDRPVWGTDCTHCMACICSCPTEAIEYGKISQGKRRYRCPK